MASKIWFFNQWGELEQTAPVTTTPRSWVLNSYGRCDFAIPLDSTLLQERLIKFGNFVLIQHIPDQTPGRTVYGKLPDWVGMIVPPRTWNDDAVVVSAVSAEAVLAFRAMPYVTLSGAPDACFKTIVQHAVNRAPNGIPIRFGQVSPASGGQTIAGGTQAPLLYSDELRTNAYEHINKLVKFAGMDWNVTGYLSQPSLSLVLYANLYNRLQGEGPNLTPENTDGNSPLLTEQGTITNHIFAYNQAQTPQTRIMQEIIIQESIDKYGDFQTNTTFTGVTDSAGMLSAAAQARANERGEPVMIVKRAVLDKLDVFTHLAVGNLSYVTDPKVGFNQFGGLGFSATARILSMDYNDLTSKCALNLELLPKLRGEK
jgi:hypothetical protein